MALFLEVTLDLLYFEVQVLFHTGFICWFGFFPLACVCGMFVASLQTSVKGFFLRIKVMFQGLVSLFTSQKLMG